MTSANIVHLKSWIFQKKFVHLQKLPINPFLQGPLSNLDVIEKQTETFKFSILTNSPVCFVFLVCPFLFCLTFLSDI